MQNQTWCKNNETSYRYSNDVEIITNCRTIAIEIVETDTCRILNFAYCRHLTKSPTNKIQK